MLRRILKKKKAPQNSGDDAAEFRKAMLIAVNRQLKNKAFPEVRETLERLMAAGHSRQEAIELIADAFTQQVLVFAFPTKQMHVSQFSSTYKALLDELK